MAKEIQLGNVCAYDFGTGFCQQAQLNSQNEIEYKNIRNCFVELPNDEETEAAMTQNDWQYIFDKESNKYYVIGEGAVKICRLFPGKVVLKRPMKSGVIDSQEKSCLLVLSEMAERLIPKAKDGALNVLTTCISSPPVDGGSDSAFHKMRLQSIVSRLGYEVNVIEEGHAVVMSSNPTMKQEDGTESKYSGCGCSFGAGRANCVLTYKNKQILGMSVSRSGDYVDQMVAQATGVDISQVISAKEKKLNLAKVDESNDVLFALNVYYREMVKFVFGKFAEKFKEVKSEFPGAVEFVLAGGTASVPGFKEMVEQVISDMDLPFEVKCVRMAEDPRNTVVRGLLTHAAASQKKKKKELEEKMKKEEQEKKVKETKPASKTIQNLDDII